MADGQYKFSIGLDGKQLELDIAQAKKAFDSLVQQAQQAGAKIDNMPNPFENIARSAPQVQQATQQFNGLNVATQQLVRELPAASMGLNTFFLAISNNLPIFADQVKNLRQQGTSVSGVLKGIGSALFSWQTALVLGVTALSMYGKEIGAWISSLFKGKSAVDAVKEATEGLNASIEKNGLGIGKEIGKYESLRREFEALNENLADQERFVRDNQSAFDDLGVAVNNVVDAEAFFSGEGTEAFLTALRLRAEALAAQKLAVEQFEKALILEAKASELPEFVKTKPGAMVETSPTFPLLGIEGAYVPAGEMAYNAERKELEAEAKAARSVGEAYFDMHDAKMKAAGDTLEDANIKQNDEQTQAQIRAAELRAKQIADASARLMVDAQRATTQAEVDAMAEGILKKIAQINLNYDLEEQTITKREEELKKLRGGMLTAQEQQSIDAMRKANVGKRDRNVQGAYNEVFADAEAWMKQAEKEMDAFSEDMDKALAKQIESWEDYHIKYGTIKEQLLATTQKYNRLIAEAENDAERKTLEAERDALLAEYSVQASAWAQELVDMSTTRLTKMLKDLQVELEAKETAYDALDSSDSASAQEYRNTINELRAKIASLQEELGKAKRQTQSGDWAGAAEVFHSIASAANETADGLEGMNDGLAEGLKAFGQLAGAAGSLVSAISVVVAASGALNMALGIIGLIAAAINAVLSVVSLFKDNYGVEETMRQFEELNKEIERTRELARIDSWKGTIFGEDAFGNFTNNLEVLRDASQALEESQKAIMGRHKFGRGFDSIEKAIGSMQVKTRDRSGFAEAFGAKDEYANLGDLMPSLFGEDGKITLKGLQELRDSDVWDKISEENRNLIDDMIADWELYEEALEATNEYMSDIFGNLGASITDSLVDAFKNGTDAAIAMGDAVADVVEQIATDMAHAAFIQPLLTQAQEGISALNQQKMDGTLTDEEYMRQLMEITSGLMGDAEAAGEDMNAFLEHLRQQAKEMGIDAFESDSAKNSTYAKGFQTMSQETGSELNGRFTDIQGQTHRIAEAVEVMQGIQASHLQHVQSVSSTLASIHNDTSLIAQHTKALGEIRDDISVMRRAMDNGII